MGQKKWRWLCGGLGVVGLGVFLMPFVAGHFKIGDRDGPAFYPTELHTALYIIGYEGTHGEKPRLSLTGALYQRPLFWGMDRRPRSVEERRRIIEDVKARDAGRTSVFIELLLEENERIGG